MSLATLKADYAEFSRRVKARLAKGAESYGNKSFGRPMVETCRQIAEELEDVAGWLYVLWIQARIKCGEAIDEPAGEKHVREFFDDLMGAGVPGNAVERIHDMAAHACARWQNMRVGLMVVLRELGEQ